MLLLSRDTLEISTILAVWRAESSSKSSLSQPATVTGRSMLQFVYSLRYSRLLSLDSRLTLRQQGRGMQTWCKCQLLWR